MNRLPRDATASSELESADRGAQSAMTLVHRLTQELSRLFRQELALAGAELTQTATKALAALAAASAGGAVLFSGFLVLLAAAVLGLSQLMAAWLAALVVGVIVSAAGVLTLIAGKRSLPETLRPQRTTRSIAKDKDVLTRKTT